MEIIMAATATSQTLFDGERVAIMKFDFITDSATGETNVVKVDPAALNPSAAGGACDEVSLLKISGLTNGMSVRMLWDATAPVPIQTVPSNTQYIQDYSSIGGLTNNAGAGKNGKILFTTYETGAGDTYTIVLEMQKHYVNPMG
jgi:hypothetical protein